MKSREKSLFVWFSLIYLLALPGVYYFNVSIFHGLNGFAPDIFQYPMLFMTAIADGAMVFLIGTLFLKEDYQKYGRFILSLILITIIVNLFKHFFETNRPAKFFGKDEIFILGNVLTIRSFPSGHSASVMVLARFLSFKRPLSTSVVVILLCSLGALSRIYIGAHFPIDVFVGGGIGFFVSDAVFRIMEKYRWGIPPRFSSIFSGLAYFAAILGGVLVIYSVSSQYPPLTTYLNVITGFLMVLFTNRLIKILTGK